MTCLSGTRVYRRGTGSSWPPLGAATGANKPHTHLGLVIEEVTLDHNVCLRHSGKASDQAKVLSFFLGGGCFKQGALVVSGRVDLLR